MDGTYVAKEYTTAHNGVTHFVYKQQFQGIDVYGAEWVVNIDRDGSVINAGGTLYRGPGVTAPPQTPSAPTALREAVRAARGRDAGSYIPIDSAPNTAARMRRFATTAFADQIEGEAVWYPVNGILRAGWVFYVPADNGIDNYATVVDDVTGTVMSQKNLTLYQSAPRGLVFERSSPEPNVTPGVATADVPPYVQRTMQSFAGDPVASPKGWVSGNATAGNNVIASENPRGVVFLSLMSPTVAPNADFSFPLALGPGAPNPMNFADAATTNLFYWANRAHDLYYQIGFDEAAGNFQQDNLGRGGVEGDPMIAFSHFGAAQNALAALNNSFFTTSKTGEDGARSSINMYIGGSNQIFADGSYDAEVIVHEYTHGVSLRLVRQLSGLQGGAMGEAWSDFYSLEFTLPEGAPADGSYPEAEYLFQWFGTGIRTRPYSTSMDINPLTYASLGRVTTGPEVHADGEIWVEALWEMRANLIRQFGETEGRRRVRLLVLDGMKLSPPAPTMVDMRDAILLADRVNFKSASQDQIWSAFARRGLGVLAQSADPDLVHISASFDKPSPAGAMQFYDSQFVLGETVRIVLQDANNTQATARIQLTGSSGDLENLVLRRTGGVFTGSIRTSSSGSVTKFDSVLELIPGDQISAYYVDDDTGDGSSGLIQITAPTQPEYFTSVTTGAPAFISGAEHPLFSLSSGRVRISSTIQTLPFPFPFFGGTQSRVRIYGDGLLTFELPASSPCTDRASLAMNTAIAAMWMSLAYGGQAQKNENVYMSTGPGSVTFRWAAETQPFLLPYLTSDPVNFSATLFDDGRIMLQYGDGNKNLANSYAFAPACSVGAPTVGISNGHATYTLTSLYHDSHPNLEKAPTLTFNPPFNGSSNPVVSVESPAPDRHYQDVLNVSGVAYDGGGGIARLDLLLDGVPRARASASTRRTDFCAAQPVPGCPTVGFNTNLNLASLAIAPGSHTLSVRATNTRGVFQDFPDAPIRFVVDPGRGRLPVGAIEAPQDGAELAGVVLVKGYVYAPDLRVVAVEVLIDGVTYGVASYTQQRRDICDALPAAAPNCPNIGFTFNLYTRQGPVQLPNGPHALQVRARDEVGRVTLIPEAPLSVTVNNTHSRPPQGVLAAPKPNDKLSGTVGIAGYAWAPDGKVRTVSLLVDGSALLTLRYGSAHPDECARIAGVDACPNIGFDGQFDTRLVPNGPHVLGVLITDDQGSSTLIPNLDRNGMNVSIQN